MPDVKFKNSSRLTDPPGSAFNINAGSALDAITRCIWVGSGGNLAVTMHENAADVVLLNVPNGTMVVGQFAAVRSAGTTAGDLVGFY